MNILKKISKLTLKKLISHLIHYPPLRLANDRASLTLVEPNPFVTHCLKRSFFNKKIACCL